MLKPGLGKSLGDLMHGDQVAGKDRPPTGNAAPLLGRGIKSLVEPEPKAPIAPAEEEVTQSSPALLPAWFYFAADLLLLAYTVAITLDAARPLDLGTVLFCATSISAGAFLAILGVLQSSAR